jgi:hypothetical protein
LTGRGGFYILPETPPRKIMPLPQLPLLLVAVSLVAAGCVTPPERPAEPAPSAPRNETRETPHPAAPAADPRDRQVAQIQLRLLAREADVARLQSEIEETRQRLDDAILEIVRSKAKLGSLGSRAEAATALSEAELLLASLRREKGASPSDLASAQKMIELGNQEFRNGNFGGAFYLSSNAKTALGVAASRQRGAPAASEASAEARFPVPIKFQFGARSSVRELPRGDSRVVRVGEKGVAIVGIANRDRWILVEFEDGARGWAFIDQLAAR